MTDEIDVTLPEDDFEVLLPDTDDFEVDVPEESDLIVEIDDPDFVVTLETVGTNESAQAQAAAADALASQIAAADSAVSAANSALAADDAATDAEIAQVAAELAQSIAEPAAFSASASASAAAGSASDAAGWAQDATDANDAAQIAKIDAESAETSATASAAAAAASAAAINLPTIIAGDAGKILFVNVTEDGYDLDDPPTGGSSDAADVTFTPAGAVAATNVQAAIAELDTEKAPLASPALTGNPTAPTQSQSDDSTKISTTAYVRAAITALIGGAGSLYDTLGEIVTVTAAHITSSSNPHSVTKTQVGLANVTNDAQLKAASNLSDVTAATARTNLGLGTAAVEADTKYAARASNLSDLASAVTARQNLLILTMSQATYDGITPNSNTIYIIT